ncbi:hypothetical protein PRZ48_010971 [Zasmidium cellare]|uniref:Uncharacterized protein n=1 Tax=Zasmidium cellare TaxID=395010 RepID=A0ABR0EB08_ZASCE|nr:hypothetical protein PRZ48_010971 [Zasmidium cellare]
MDSPQTTAEAELKVFRLMDLAPELRNRIYEYALVQNRFQEQLANTALLRVSKEVHREAKGIFWSQATFCTRISRPKTSTCTLPMAIKSHAIIGDVTMRVEESTALDTFIDFFPSAILRVPRIQIELFSIDSMLPHYLLYCLASTLHRSDLREQDLTITIQYGTNRERQMAYPLLRMPPHVNIFYHSADKASEKEVHAWYLEGNKVKAHRPACTLFDAPVQMKQLRPKIQTYLHAWHEKFDGQKEGYGLLPKERRLIGKYAKRMDEKLKSCAGLFSDRLRMAYTMTLARWVEMKEAGVVIGDTELRQLKRSFTMLEDEKDDGEAKE